MRVHVHTKFCFLCVLTFFFQQCTHCHEGHSHQTGRDHDEDHNGFHSDLQISEAPFIRAATLPPKSASPEGASLEEEQQFYILQLFRRYGQKDRLDFEGFQNMLSSLGLGEVKVVDIDHEDLGHDHVAHLDLLDVKNKLHSHSSSSEEHDHHHHHGGDHVHPKPRSHNPHKELAPTRCINTTKTSQEHLHSDMEHSNRTHSHHHVADTNNHNHHNHDHTHDEDHQHENSHIESQNHRNVSSKSYNHHKQKEHRGGHKHEDHQGHTGTDQDPMRLPQSSPAPTDRPRRHKKPPKVRGQKGPNTLTTKAPPSVGEGHEHNPDLHHHHKRSHVEKREAPGVVATPALPVHPGHPGGLSHQHEECLNLSQLLTYYGLSPDSLISPSQFTYLCPALLYQIDSRVCIRHYHQMDVKQEGLESASSVWVWVWGFVSITIISLLSLLGVVLVPILKQSCFKFLLTFLVALAVGTLSGDALLHLLPHSQGQHDHSQHRPSDNADMVTEFDGVWKGLTALAGIYLLFIIEHCIGMFKHFKDQRVLTKGAEEGKIGRKLSDHKLNRRSDIDWVNMKPLNEDPDTSAISSDNTHNDTQLTELQTPDSPTPATSAAVKSPQQQQSPAKENGWKVKKHSHSHGHGHSHGGNCHSDQEMKDAGIASIAWMVIMGDGMHNFSDGLAIGAAFSANLTGGISTSVAVFCHELPHELGDFAVLLKAGMSVKQAIVYNLLSALMAYVGMLIGTAVGQYTHNVTNWIFAITAGMFLYVALVDMLPEMLHGDSEEHKRCHLGHFVLQNMGLLTGFSIMLLIAIFEDRIVFDFGF